LISLDILDAKPPHQHTASLFVPVHSLLWRLGRRPRQQGDGDGRGRQQDEHHHADGIPLAPEMRAETTDGTDVGASASTT
jgi:hypothetical protein